MKDQDIIALVLGLSFFALIGYLTFIYITKKEEVIQTPTVQNYYVQAPIQNCPTPLQEKKEIIKTTEYAPTTAHIINHHLNNANQWYEIKMPRDAITWQLKARGNYELLYSYSPTHQTYMTLTKGDVLSSDTSPNRNINAIYVMCETANVVAELEVWRK